MSNQEVYDSIVDRILAALDSGNIPWRKPWAVTWPVNAVSKKAYTGINPHLLMLAGYSDNRWMTYKQAQSLGGNVRKGEKSTSIIFAKRLIVDDTREDAKEGATRPIFLLRLYHVFNAEQCDGLKLKPITIADSAPGDVLEQAEAIVQGMPNPPRITEGGSSAFYRPSSDSITIPPRTAFDSDEFRYSVLFHEMTHSTGHASRLDRVGVTEVASFGSPVYSYEELVAEFGAAFLCGHAGIANITVDNSAAYIQGWKAALKADRKMVVKAASAAQKAAEHIIGTYEQEDC
jgi:antirestriction protein ArdC